MAERSVIREPAPDHGHAGQHHFHLMADDVLRGAAFEAVDADGRHAAVAALVKADRKIEILIKEKILGSRELWAGSAGARARFRLRRWPRRKAVIVDDKPRRAIAKAPGPSFHRVVGSST